MFRYLITALALLFLSVVLLRISPLSFQFSLVSSKDQLAERGILALEIVRPKRYPPREWLSTAGMNPLNFWSWMADPTFKTSTTASEIRSLSTGEAQYQLIRINPSFEHTKNREDVLVVKTQNQLAEIPLPSPKESTSLFEVGELYSSAEASAFLASIGFNTKVIVMVDFDSDGAHLASLVSPDQKEFWDAAISEAKLFVGDKKNREKICHPRSIATNLFLKEFLDFEC